MMSETKVSTSQSQRPAIGVYRGSDQTGIVTSTYTIIKFNSDMADFFAEGYNSTTGKYTCPLDGKYLVTGHGHILNLGSADTQYFRIISDSESLGYRQVARTRFVNADANHEQGLRVTAFINCEKDDEIYMEAWHNYGSNRDYDDGSWSRFSIIYLGK